MMVKNTPFVLVFCLFARNMHAQSNQRYKDFVFNNIKVEKDLNYNLAAGDKAGKSYLFDLYQPQGDTVQQRPLIIWMHGGGFKFGSKDDRNIQLWCKTFAQRGYVCVGLNYRGSKKNTLFNFDELTRACYLAVQDLKIAVAFFKTNATTYRIDPGKIILAGNSAGGMISLQAAFSKNDELAVLAKVPPGEKAKDNADEPMKIAAVINFWGAIYNLNWLKNAKTPIVCVLGSKDSVIPPTHKSAPLYGGVDIHNEADRIGLPNELKVFEGYSHELQKHFNPFFSGSKATQERWLQAGQFAADFICKNIVK